MDTLGIIVAILVTAIVAANIFGRIQLHLTVEIPIHELIPHMQRAYRIGWQEVSGPGNINLRARLLRWGVRNNNTVSVDVKTHGTGCEVGVWLSHFQVLIEPHHAMSFWSAKRSARKAIRSALAARQSSGFQQKDSGSAMATDI